MDFVAGNWELGRNRDVVWADSSFRRPRLKQKRLRRTSACAEMKYRAHLRIPFTPRERAPSPRDLCWSDLAPVRCQACCNEYCTKAHLGRLDHTPPIHTMPDRLVRTKQSRETYRIAKRSESSRTQCSRHRDRGKRPNRLFDERDQLS
jgi:hypothetical protein